MAGCSTIDPLVRLLHASGMSQYHHNLETEDSESYFAVLFVDFSKAYDRVEPTTLVSKLLKLGIQQEYCNFIRDWMSQRSIVVKFEDERSDITYVTRGLPQGSSLSVMLWQLYISDMPLDAQNSALYMDDTALWRTEPTRGHLEERLQADLSIISEWCKVNHVVINTDKTVIMVNDLNNEITLDLDNQEIHTVQKTRYLGVDLESRKGFREQIYVNVDSLIEKLEKTTHLLKPIRSRLPQHILYNIGRALLISKLNYYLPVMGAETQTGVFVRLQTQLNRYLRTLANSPLSTPIVLLQSQTSIPPVQTLMTRTVASNLARMLTNPTGSLELTYANWNGEGWNTTPLSLFDKLRAKIRPIQGNEETHINVVGKSRLPADVMTTFRKLQFHVVSDKATALQLHKRHRLIRSYDISIWTDGSLKFEHGISASAGWIYSYNDIHKSGNAKVYPPLSSYHSESVAMTRGLRQLRTDLEVDKEELSIGIFTDSHGLCDHLKKIWLQDIPVETHSKELVNELVELFKLSPDSITINWIPSHQGIGLNELADKQAELGHLSLELATIPYTRHWIKRRLYDVADAEFAKHLRENVRQSQLCIEYPGRSLFTTPRTKLDSSRGYGGESLFHLQTGHTYLRSHQHLVNKKVKDDVCSWCNGNKETADHILLHCTGLEGLQEIRAKLLRAMKEMTLREAIAKDDEDINKLLLKLILKLRKKKVWI